jgi:hypothetical protein
MKNKLGLGRFGALNYADGDGAGAGAAGGGNAGGGDGAGGDNGAAGGGGDGGGSWTDSLPSDFRNAPFIAKAANQADALQAIQNAASWMGNSIRIPGPDASDADKTAFAQKAMEKIPGLMQTPNFEDPAQMAAIMKKMGKPDTAEGYKAPESMDAGQAAQLQAMALESGMTVKQWDTFSSKMAATQNEGAGAAKLAQEQAMQTLVGEWGMAYDQKAADVFVLMQKMQAPAEMIQAVKDRTIEAGQLRMWDRMVESIGSEGNPLSSMGKDQGPGFMTPAEAKSQIDEIMARPEYFDKASPQQAALRAKVQKLFSYVPAKTNNPFENA